MEGELEKYRVQTVALDVTPISRSYSPHILLSWPILSQQPEAV